MRYLTISIVLILLSCKSQNGTYQNATQPLPEPPESSAKVSVEPPKMSKGTIRLHGEVVEIDGQMVEFKVIDVLAVGPQATSTVPVRNQTIQLNNGTNYALVQNSQYRLEVRMSSKDSGRGSILKLLED